MFRTRDEALRRGGCISESEALSNALSKDLLQHITVFENIKFNRWSHYADGNESAPPSLKSYTVAIETLATVSSLSAQH